MSMSIETPRSPRRGMRPLALGLGLAGALALAPAMAGEATVASAPPEGSPQAAQPDTTVIAALHLKDGSIVQFQEPVPGEVVVLAQTPVAGKGAAAAASINGVPAAQLEGLDAIALYRRLSGGRTPPAALVKAHRRAEAAKASTPAPAPQGLPVDISPNADKTSSAQPQPAPQPMSYYPVGSANWFKLNYCIWRDEYCYCLTNRTGDGTLTRDTTNMDTATYPYRGNITQAVEYQDCFLWSCSWKTASRQTVFQGWVGRIWSSGSKRLRRATIRDAWGDGFHWSVYGGWIGKSCSVPSLACSCQNP